jgi:hypothetical protein
MRKQLIDFFLDYVNNYLTVAGIAEAHNLEFEDANNLINMGRKYHEEDCKINSIIND